MEPQFAAIAIGVSVAAIILARQLLSQANARKTLGKDPIQPRLAEHVERYVYSLQDPASYRTLAEAARHELAGIGPISEKQALKRLMHAAELNSRHVKSGLRKKPSPSQTLGAAKSLIRLSKEL